LYIKIQEELELFDLFGFIVYKDRSHKTQIPLLERKSLNDYGLKHGDMIYVVEDKSQSPVANDSTNNNSTNNHYQNNILTNDTKLVEDEVDVALHQQNGLIERPPDPNFCRHGLNAKCLHCAPIEPYNESYLREHNIKHMSFHTYLRKVTNGIDK